MFNVLYMRDLYREKLLLALFLFQRETVSGCTVKHSFADIVMVHSFSGYINLIPLSVGSKVDSTEQRDASVRLVHYKLGKKLV